MELSNLSGTDVQYSIDESTIHQIIEDNYGQQIFKLGDRLVLL